MQAEIVGATASVVSLIGAAFTLVREIRTAREQVRGVTKTLENTSQQLEILEQSLHLVREEKALQTPDVVRQVGAVARIAEEIKIFFSRLAAEQRRNTMSQFVHALKSGDKKDRELREMLDRLDRARGELVLRISVAQVGLVGSLQDRFCATFDILRDVSDTARLALGANLEFVDRLGNKTLRQTEAHRRSTGPYSVRAQVCVDTSRMTALKAPDMEEEPDGCGARYPTQEGGAAPTDNTALYNNITLGRARIMTGNVGVDNWQRMARRRTIIAHNQFGNDVSIMTGNQGEAAMRFNESFWS